MKSNRKAPTANVSPALRSAVQSSLLNLEDLYRRAVFSILVRAKGDQPQAPGQSRQGEPSTGVRSRRPKRNHR